MVSQYDKLDAAIDRWLAGADGERAETAEFQEMLEVAPDLRELPRPEFKDRLRAELLRECRERTLKERTISTAPVRPMEHAKNEPILPSLFGQGMGYEVYPVRRGNLAASFAIHAAALVLVLTSGIWMVQHHGDVKAQVTVAAENLNRYLMIAHNDARGGGGGGENDHLDASRGQLPKTSTQQFTPPTVVVRNQHPLLPVDQTVVAPEIKVVTTLPDLGNPNSDVKGPLANGVGSGSGIGTGSGGGVGSGSGAGVGSGIGGGIGGGLYAPGTGGVTAPHALYAPEPEFSDEARKARFQGVATVSLIVDADGTPKDVRIRHAVGMGLDEKAVEAVRKWKFAPATKNGRPVPVGIEIDVSFKLF